MLRGKKLTVTVRKLMAAPVKYDGMTCADPLDGDYDGGRRTVAKFFANPGGTPAINDLHTGTVFLLRQSAADAFDSEDSSRSVGGENIVSFGRFISQREPLKYVVQNVLARNYVYALTAPWGAGKTAVAVTLAIAVASGDDDIIGFPVDQCRVLYLSGENPGDVSLRAEQTAKHFGVDQALLDKNLCFTLRPFPINDEEVRAGFVREALEHGEFGLVVIDTSSAHSHIDDENGNAEMHRLAQSFRQLGRDLGQGPAVLVLCHPAKQAQKKDDLQPRGGGAFSASIDGELTLMRTSENNFLELSHRMKFRGPGFDSAYFRLDKQTVEGELDNFFSPVRTVVAVCADPLDAAAAAADVVPLSANALLALTAVNGADLLYGEETGFPRAEAYAAYDRNQRHVAKGAPPTASAWNKARERAFSELVGRGCIRIEGRGRAARVLPM